MRAVLWDLLLLCLFARARGDCRGDCLHCDRQLYRDSFDVLICILECEGEAVPRATWELCAAASRASPRAHDLAAEPWPGVAPENLPWRRDADGAAPGAFPQPPEDISRRLGMGWRAAPAAKGVQKRYGGFIGVRKSARKWNNQKRFSEFLKQYLGMSPRSTFRHRIPAPSARHRQN
ncbi:prepronociceptin isoform X1 [Chiroxiphia lanceolata]|uniref:prepronociceptin isoform X1 n=1 Tax=Chiroxiphia lanceolata TaxID=296741 RepID=UPI0013CEACAC|nr:prepronociceptin isoform X1 [Chiroxiphia lanceolata]XP_032539752.1 prepronociceptin isoform X1 [Chiroxiphia lanceolata]